MSRGLDGPGHVRTKLGVNSTCHLPAQPYSPPFWEGQDSLLDVLTSQFRSARPAAAATIALGLSSPCTPLSWSVLAHPPLTCFSSHQASQRIIHGPIYGLAGFISLALKRVTLSTLLWWQIQKIMNRTEGKCRSYLNRANYNPEISYLFERWWKHSIRVASRWFYKPKRIHRTMHGLHYSGWICNKFESLVSTWRVVSPSGF